MTYLSLDLLDSLHAALPLHLLRDDVPIRYTIFPQLTLVYVMHDV